MTTNIAAGITFDGWFPGLEPGQTTFDGWFRSEIRQEYGGKPTSENGSVFTASSENGSVFDATSDSGSND